MFNFFLLLIRIRISLVIYFLIIVIFLSAIKFILLATVSRAIIIIIVIYKNILFYCRNGIYFSSYIYNYIYIFLIFNINVIIYYLIFLSSSLICLEFIIAAQIKINLLLIIIFLIMF